MLKQLKSLSKLRKLYLTYQLLVAACNVFLIAVTATLIIKHFDTLGIILRDYSATLFGLLLFIPGISKYITRNPMKCYPYIVAIEITCVTGYMVASRDIYPEFILVASMFFWGATNTLVRPLRAKNYSQVIKGDGDYAVLSERVSSISLVLVTALGVWMTWAGISTLVNAALTIIFMAGSRWVYHYFLIELLGIETKAKEEVVPAH